MNHTVIYDAGCNLCTGIVRFVKRRKIGSRFRFIPLQSEDGRQMLILAGLPSDKADTVVYQTDKGVYLRSTAVLNILKDLGGLWTLFYIFIIIPSPVRDYGYKVVSQNRYIIFGKKNSCDVQSLEVLPETSDILSKLTYLSVLIFISLSISNSSLIWHIHYHVLSVNVITIQLFQNVMFPSIKLWNIGEKLYDTYHFTKYIHI